MAQVDVRVQLDSTPLRDAVDQLACAFRALACRHGPAFRQLERDMGALTDADWEGAEATDLGEGEFILGAPPAISSLLRRCRQLGVI